MGMTDTELVDWIETHPLGEFYLMREWVKDEGDITFRDRCRRLREKNMRISMNAGAQRREISVEELCREDIS